MQKKNLDKFILFGIILLLLGPNAVLAKTVIGYDDLLKSLPGGKATRVENLKTINDSQKIAMYTEKKKRSRDIEFKKPVEIHYISKKYLSIAFEVKIVAERGRRGINKPAIFAMLYTHKGQKGITFDKKVYLRWVDSDDIVEYQKINIKMLCTYYQKNGIADCVYEEQKPIVKKPTKKAPPKPVVLNADDIKKGTVDEKFIDETIARDREVVGLLTGKADSNHTHEEIKTLEAKISKLESQISTLTALLKGVSRNGNTLVFNKMNVQVTSGAGKSNARVNGLGNVIVGYNEAGGKKTGSHNIVVGPNHSYTSYGGIVAGTKNSISGVNAVSIGGLGNKADGQNACSIGGENNIAHGKFSSVNGGHNNKAVADYSIISGGKHRTVTKENPHFTN